MLSLPYFAQRWAGRFAPDGLTPGHEFFAAADAARRVRPAAARIALGDLEAGVTLAQARRRALFAPADAAPTAPTRLLLLLALFQAPSPACDVGLMARSRLVFDAVYPMLDCAIQSKHRA